RRSPSAASTSSKTERASGQALARSLPTTTVRVPCPGKVNATDMSMLLRRLPARRLRCARGRNSSSAPPAQAGDVSSRASGLARAMRDTYMPQAARAAPVPWPRMQSSWRNAPHMRPVISISRLSKTYKGGFQALKEVSLDIEEGEILALLGPNGAGKTTLISIVCGIVNPSSGTVTVGGHDIIRDFRKARELIGLVPQEMHVDA